MKLYLSIAAILILSAFAAGFTFGNRQHQYSVVGRWQLVDMQIGSDEEAKTKNEVRKELQQNKMRLVFEESGDFLMELGENGRGLRGGYLYDSENQILSIRYGSRVDTALVTWKGADKMIHATKDGQTRTVMVRVEE